MKSNLRVLLIEDDDSDVELIKHELEMFGFPFRLERIQTEAELRREMDTETPDIILSDHGLPSFSGFKALQIVRELHPKLPFIFVSGSNDQGMIEEMYEEGATDYIFKKDIKDLKSAMLQALESPAEAEPTSVQSEATSIQHEFELQLPPIATTQPIFYPAIGHLLFCPQCRQTWDEAGRLTQMDNYCGNYSEIIVIRELCSHCARRRG